MNTNENLLAVSAPPFWHFGKTVKNQMQDISLALMPAAIAAFMVWGFSALHVIGLSVATCVVVEAICQKLMGRALAIYDYSAFVIGLLFAFMLPATAPWWLVVIGAALSITLGKNMCGDYGAAPLCAPVVGFLLCFVSWPIFTDPNAMLLSTDYIDPLVRLKYFGASSLNDISTQSLLMGEQIGALGASQPGMLLLGGIYLCVRGSISWEIPLAFIIGTAVTAFIYQQIDPTLYAGPVFHLLTGSTMLAAFFLATDAPSSPNRVSNMFIYGLIGGVLVVIIRIYGIYPDGVPFVILLINLLMPLLEGRKQKPFGME